jgi:hypothetical protein
MEFIDGLQLAAGGSLAAVASRKPSNGTRAALFRLASDFEIADRDGKSAISS